MYALIFRAISRINNLMGSGRVHPCFICGRKRSCVFFEKMDLYLKDNGIIYFSGKNGIPTGKAADGRYFFEFTEQLVEKILAANERMQLEELWYTKM